MINLLSSPYLTYQQYLTYLILFILETFLHLVSKITRSPIFFPAFPGSFAGASSSLYSPCWSSQGSEFCPFFFSICTYPVDNFCDFKYTGKFQICISGWGFSPKLQTPISYCLLDTFVSLTVISKLKLLRWIPPPTPTLLSIVSPLVNGNLILPDSLTKSLGLPWFLLVSHTPHPTHQEISLSLMSKYI